MTDKEDNMLSDSAYVEGKDEEDTEDEVDYMLDDSVLCSIYFGSTCVEGNDEVDMDEVQEGGQEEGGKQGTEEEDDSDWCEGDEDEGTGEDEHGGEDEGDDEGDEEPEDDQHVVGQLWLPGEWVELLFRYQIADHLVHPASDDIGD